MNRILRLLILISFLSTTLIVSAENFPEKIDAACNNGNGKTYFFSGSQYWRWDNQSESMDSGYPTQISRGWSGIPNNLDAATYGVTGKGNGKLYLFKGSEYWRWDIASDTMDSGYPKSLSNGWPGVNTHRIDCALRVDSTHIVLITGDQFWLWDMTTDSLEKGPLPVSDEHPQLPANLDAAVWDDTVEDGAVFFKGTDYWEI